MDDFVASLDNVSKSYGKIEALKSLTFRLSPGVCYGLVGRNGAGKSTLLKLLMGMLRPTWGTVQLFGGDPIEEAERVKLHVGYLAEDQVFPKGLRPVTCSGSLPSATPPGTNLSPSRSRTASKSRSAAGFPSFRRGSRGRRGSSAPSRTGRNS